MPHKAHVSPTRAPHWSWAAEFSTKTKGMGCLLDVASQQQPEGPLTEGPSTQESHPDHARGFTTEATIH